ncbi:uncharacterized protein DUF742 [Herbihabitans rhizosphaerae]|uniref:Uncharacterized protein DUF742 n=1 Tax=Herbihabitans rhizosphaerae TaxID=1872711 RepID=A0A4Q7KJ39_9PSEU|nr:DUF742 domain-containing protein [Herbihabitans rhizosphaerae]RZS34245.1 uncharacterized protein DUF742 [Herbihabitans rhizosphaerae]
MKGGIDPFEPRASKAARQQAEEETFADVVHGFTIGSGRRGRRKRRDKADEGLRPPPTPAPSPSPTPAPSANVAPEPDESREPAVDDASIVRPYAWTGGRTKSTVQLQLETLVTTTDRGRDESSVKHAEHRSVAEICLQPRSVAEIASMFGVPLGVAKVLVGDMADLGLVTVHRTAADEGATAQLMLMERVLSGLRRL